MFPFMICIARVAWSVESRGLIPRGARSGATEGGGGSGASPPCENNIIVKTQVLFAFAQHFSVPKLLKYQYEVHTINGNSGQEGGLIFAASRIMWLLDGAVCVPFPWQRLHNAIPPKRRRTPSTNLAD